MHGTIYYVVSSLFEAPQFLQVMDPLVSHPLLVVYFLFLLNDLSDLVFDISIRHRHKRPGLSVSSTRCSAFHTHKHEHTRTQTHHTHKRAHVHTHKHTHVHTHTRAHTYTHTNTHTYTHTHTHTHRHTHTHTHTCWFLWFTGTFHRHNGFYTVQTVCAIALHLPYT